MSFKRIIAAMVVVAAAGCGQNAAPPASTTTTPAPAPAAAPAEAPKSASTVNLIEPLEGAMSGHIDTFHWSAVDGADGYVIKIVAVTGNRVVWESAPMTVTETRLPSTVALEPEAYTWSVTARKGAEVLATSATQKFTITP